MKTFKGVVTYILVWFDAALAYASRILKRCVKDQRVLRPCIIITMLGGVGDYILLTPVFDGISPPVSPVESCHDCSKLKRGASDKGSFCGLGDCPQLSRLPLESDREDSGVDKYDTIGCTPVCSTRDYSNPSRKARSNTCTTGHKQSAALRLNAWTAVMSGDYAALW